MPVRNSETKSKLLDKVLAKTRKIFPGRSLVVKERKASKMPGGKSFKILVDLYDGELLVPIMAATNAWHTMLENEIPKRSQKLFRISPNIVTSTN